MKRIDLIKELSINQLSVDEQSTIKNIIQLVNSDKIQDALKIAEKLRPEVQGLLPDSVLFKFSQLSEMSGTGGSAGFTPGTGLGVATKNAFGNKRHSNKFGRNGRKIKKKTPKLSSIMAEILLENNWSVMIDVLNDVRKEREIDPDNWNNEKFETILSKYNVSLGEFKEWLNKHRGS